MDKKMYIEETLKSTIRILQNLNNYENQLGYLDACKSGIEACIKLIEEDPECYKK